MEVTQALKQDFEKTPWKDDIASGELTRAQPRIREVAPSMVQLVPFERYLSRVCRALEAAEAGRVWQQADADRRANLLTCGGPGTGQFWTRVPRSPLEHLPNAHWRQCVLSRLDVRPQFGEKRCQLCRPDDPPGEVCGTMLANTHRHSELCKKGAARMRSHGHVAAALVQLAAGVGMTADLERYVPELYEKLGTPSGEIRTRKAIMDVVLGVPGLETHLLIDVSIRSVAASRYAGAAAGQAAIAGEKEKLKRYGPSVLPLVFEAGGRLGKTSLESLQTVVSTAASARLCSSFAASRWRSRLERAVLFGTADAALRAAGADTAQTLHATQFSVATFPLPCATGRF